MSFVRSKSTNSPRPLTGMPVIIEDVAPRSSSNPTCRCSCCPTVARWCLKDPLGLTVAFITWFLFLYGQCVMLFVVLVPSNYSFRYNFFHLLVIHLLEFLAVSSHCRTMFINPGAVPLNNATPENLLNYPSGTVVQRCTACQCIKPARAHHCRICRRCIQRMDHHCTFVNNCVGQNNQKYFILFTFYTCLLSLYGVGLLYVHITHCVGSNWIACPAWSPPLTIICVIGAGLEGFSFAIFTAIMTGIQFYCIYTDTTSIKFQKHGSPSGEEKRTFLSSLKLVFGASVGLRWLNPYSKPHDVLTQNDDHITFEI